MSSIPGGNVAAWQEELATLDTAWEGGDAISPDAALAELTIWRTRLGRPEQLDEEWLDVVSAAGEPLGWAAPRWFCHLTGLRHRVVHIFLTTPQDLMILQMRGHDKAEWPSLFDTTVGGHLKAGQGWGEGALSEIEEEIGLPAGEVGKWLRGGHLIVTGPTYERYGVGRVHQTSELLMRNRQVNQIFGGQLTDWGLSHLHFHDGELDGVFLCRPEEARRMLAADFLIAPGLRNAFGRWWAWRAGA